MAAQHELRADLDRLAQYGERFPDTWVGLSFDGHLLVALFTDPEPHRQPLLSLLDHPESLVLRRSAHSRRDLAAAYKEVRRVIDANPGCWTSYAPGLTAVQASLYGGNEALAHELHERFGDAIELRVGVHRYPFDIGSTPEPGPRFPPQATLQLPRAHLEAVPDPDTLRTGATITGRVHVTNTAGDARLTFETDQPLTGHVLGASGHVVGVSSGFSAGIGRSVDLGPGESGEIGFLAGTDSLDLRLGSTLPAGHYHLVVDIPIRRQNDPAARMVTAPVDIELRN